MVFLALGLTLALSGPLAISGCGSIDQLDGGLIDLSPPTTPADLSAAPDLGTAPDLASTADMATGSNADAAPTQTRTCLGIVTCLQSCGAELTCQDACIASGTQAAQAAFQSLISCAYGVCTMPAYGGAAQCMGSMDRSPACAACLNTAGLSSSCSTQFSACTSTM